MIYLCIVCFITGCAFDEELLTDLKKSEKINKLSDKKNHSKTVTLINDNNIVVITSETAKTNDYFTLGNDPVSWSILNFGADWFGDDWSGDPRADTMTFEVLVTYPYIDSTLTLQDSAYHLIRSTAGYNYMLSDDITVDYENTFDQLSNNVGSFIYFKYQFRDTQNYTYVSKLTKVKITYQQDFTQVEEGLNSWFSNTSQGYYYVDSVEFVDIDTTYTYVSGGKNYYLSQDTIFTNQLYYGYWDNDLHKVQTDKGGWAYKANMNTGYDENRGYVGNFNDWAGGCCEHIKVTNYPAWMSVIRSKSAGPYTFRLKFRGLRIKVHQ